MNWESSEGGSGAQIPEWPPMAVIFNPRIIEEKRALSQLCRRGARGKRMWRDLPASQTFHVAKLGLDPGGLDCESVSFGPGSAQSPWNRSKQHDPGLLTLQNLQEILLNVPVYLVTILVSTDQRVILFHFAVSGTWYDADGAAVFPVVGMAVCAPGVNAAEWALQPQPSLSSSKVKTGAKKWSQESVPSAGLF